MAVVFDKPKFLTDTPLHYCPGCTHGIAHRLVAEALEEVGAEKVVGVAPVGCSVFAYNYFNCDMQQAAHGRAPSVAQGIKLVNPDNIVFAYQGDGDLASIGMAEIVHACARGANITIIFIKQTAVSPVIHQSVPGFTNTDPEYEIILTLYHLKIRYTGTGQAKSCHLIHSLHRLQSVSLFHKRLFVFPE